MSINRREFLKYSTGGVAALVVGSNMPWLLDNEVHAATQSLNFTITDGIKDMATHNVMNPARCYFWLFKEATLPAEVPGPHIFVTQGDTIAITVTNALDEPHAWAVPALGFSTGPIAPGQTVSTSFVAGRAGTYLYFDPLNWPVNRVMGLHGALIIMPAAAPFGHKFTPYTNPPAKIQQLFDDLGPTPWFPGLAWEQGDPATNTRPFRQTIWLLHQASPNLFAEVGDWPAGQNYPAAQFVQKFLRDPFSPTNANGIPQYFTISGQSGHFSHNNPYINPNHRVGEPTLVRILNAGLWTHSMHIHANHFYLLNVSNAAVPATEFFAQNSIEPRGLTGGGVAPAAAGAQSETAAAAPVAPVGDQSSPPANLNPNLGGNNWNAGLLSLLLLANKGLKEGNLIWLDVYTVAPLDIVDYLIPYMRPPSIPNARGIGRADAGLLTLTGGGVGRTWPPNEEISTILPTELEVGAAQDSDGNPVSLAVQLSPMTYPMHDHSEPSQTSQGGNYNMGMIAGINFIGDRNTPGGVTNFPHQPVVDHPGPLGVFPPTVPPPWFDRHN